MTDISYNFVKLHTPVKIAGRYFAEIDVDVIMRDSNVNCKIVVSDNGVYLRTDSQKYNRQVFLIPYNNIIYIESK